MKIAYLILAHNTPRHLSRLVAALSSESSGFFIHLDRKSNEEDFRNIEGPGVHLAEERVAVYWGDFSQVEATLLILRAALADPRDFDRFVLLSGSDYPLRSASFIEQFFARNADKEFINLVTMPMMMCSGVFFSSNKFPAMVQPLIKALPLTALNDALRAVMIDGAGVAQVAKPLAVVTAWCLVSFAVALKIFRWR